MSTEILSTSLGETLALKDVIPLAQGMGAVALADRHLAGSAIRIMMGGDNTDGGDSHDPFPNKPGNVQFGRNEDSKPFSLSDSVRVTASFDGDDWPDKETKEGKISEADKKRQDDQRANNLSDSVRITMGGEEDLSDDGYNPDDDNLRKDKGPKSLVDSVRITMGGVNGDDTDSGRGPGSSDPFERTEAERRKYQ